jgi:hypothetical protein
MSPFEAWYQKKPDASHLRVFGSLAFVHIHPDTVGWYKLQPKAKAGILIGYEGPGYRVFVPEENKIKISSHVDIKEDQPGANHFGIGVRAGPSTSLVDVNDTSQESTDSRDSTDSTDGIQHSSKRTSDPEDDTIVVEVPELDPLNLNLKITKV